MLLLEINAVPKTFMWFHTSLLPEGPSQKMVYPAHGIMWRFNIQYTSYLQHLINMYNIAQHATVRKIINAWCNFDKYDIVQDNDFGIQWGCKDNQGAKKGHFNYFQIQVFAYITLQTGTVCGFTFGTFTTFTTKGKVIKNSNICNRHHKCEQKCLSNLYLQCKYAFLQLVYIYLEGLAPQASRHSNHDFGVQKKRFCLDFPLL